MPVLPERAKMNRLVADKEEDKKAVTVSILCFSGVEPRSSYSMFEYYSIPPGRWKHASFHGFSSLLAHLFGCHMQTRRPFPAQLHRWDGGWVRRHGGTNGKKYIWLERTKIKYYTDFNIL